ncbi:MAG TPA: tyrosine-type recombinase/integrase [Ignavibacteriaceae bacterium]|nr:tyrosine-type recombinase/integrase [Ignavibacteriaceae bacterium]
MRKNIQFIAASLILIVLIPLNYLCPQGSINLEKNLKVEKKRPDYYTEAELKLFFAQEMPEQYRNAFIGFLFTGVRFGELANLTWADVDFEKRLIYIRPKENFKTKTYNSERSIPMNKVLHELLKRIAAALGVRYLSILFIKRWSTERKTVSAENPTPFISMSLTQEVG